jgi:hypothetical protein
MTAHLWQPQVGRDMIQTRRAIKSSRIAEGQSTGVKVRPRAVTACMLVALYAKVFTVTCGALEANKLA